MAKRHTAHALSVTLLGLSASADKKAVLATEDGFRLYKSYLDRPAQSELVETVLQGIVQSPLFTPHMPRSGKPMRVRMTNFGLLGWVARPSGYAYEQVHPETGQPWPDMPQALVKLWNHVSDWPELPQACLVNWYDAQAGLGMHIDADEDARDAPVVSISLGDDALFRLGRATPGGQTQSYRLSSGDVVVLGGASRRFRHGVDRIYPGTSTLLPNDWRPGRINLTLRRVN